MRSNPNNTDRIKVGDHTILFKRGKKWHTEYYDGGQQYRKSLKTTSLKQAKTLAIRIDADITSGDLRRPRKAWRIDETMQDYMQHLRVDRRRRPSTLKRYAAILERFEGFARQKGVTKLRQIRVSLLREYRAWRESSVAPLTLHQESTIAKQLLNFAVDDERTERNPFKRLKLTKPKPRPQPVFTAVDVEAILAEAREPWRSIFTVLAYTGLRIAELTHLAWGDVDLRGHWLHVRAKNGWAPKGGDDRELPLHPRALAVLQRQQHRSRWVFCSDDRDGDGNHRRVDDRSALGKLKTVLQHVDIKEGKLHTFRRFFITTSADAGVPATMLIRWVGHSDLKTILEYYDTDRAAWQAAMSGVPFGAQAAADGADPEQGQKEDRKDEQEAA